jgi:FixJ family two-component response regulator
MPAPQRRRVVTIVDDDPGMLGALSDLLHAHGMETNVFRSAEEWLDHRGSTATDCLVVDIHLGGISGIELLQQLKAGGCALPVIFITALGDDAIQGRALDAGGLACLRKPFSSRQLITAIERALSGT